MLTKQSSKHKNSACAGDWLPLFCLAYLQEWSAAIGVQISICTVSKDSSSISNTGSSASSSNTGSSTSSSNIGSSNSSSISPTAVKLRKLQHGRFQQQAVIITPADLQPG
ncbi:TPA: hypothetical protein ACH3X3_003443 [Trebouxia sp. C0006]